ncbi:aromatic amino acid lyase [Paracoccus aurantiacus]|uniref:Aromatic amino acid lyase n=1 Tax=Paracoccus aurantiacus TaxID=2599412 RepID=A0A5C6S018_9RHOB|nr:aromatic amino acid ammonia-lyase [Paracoccus aurantiacus]TXB68186.1 aromatic amino acid lyase [Paracoccus aurantiacus]
MNSNQIVLDGTEIDLATLRRIAAGDVRIEIADTAIDRVQAGRDSFMAALDRGQAIYGSTTGVGALKDVEQHGSEMVEYTRSLPFAHQVAVGEDVPDGLVRLTMALRLNSALTGQVGVSVGFVRFLQKMLEKGLLPVMNVRGTAGAADLGQMGQLATVMAGEGMARLNGRKMPAAEALALAGMAPYPMPPRDGLAAVATNSFGLAKAAMYIIRAGCTLRREMALALMAAQAMGQSRDVWLAAGHNGLPQERWVALWLLASSADCDWPKANRVHDPLSARMIAQIFGASANAILEAGRAVRAETAHVDDNPIVVDGRVVTSGGSLLLSLSMRMASVQLALAHLARNAFNRCLLMVNGQLEGLPVNLVPPGVVATGYGPIMKLALEQVVRVTDASTPVSVLNQAVAAGLEDEAAFISLTAWRLAEQLDALDWLQAVEAILSAQALDLRGVAPAPGVVEHLYRETRRHVPTLTRDIPQSAGITAVREALCSHGLQAELLELAPLSPFDDILGIAPEPETERNASTRPKQEHMQ